MQALAKIKNRNLFIYVVLIIAGFGIYLNSLNGDFIWDEDFLIINNLHIRSWENIGLVFKEDIGAGAEVGSKFYRPMQILTYIADYSFWRLNTLGYHLTSVSIHILVALVLYWLINMLFSNRAVSFLTALLFLIHPIQTVTVAYIATRADLLAALFILLCVGLYIKQGSSKNKIIFSLILLNYILALLSKEYSLIVPLILLLYSYIFKKKILKVEFFSILGLALIYIILRMTLLSFDIPKSDFETKYLIIPSLLQRIPAFLVAITEYCRLLLLPFNLHIEYPFKLFSFAEPRVIFGAIILFALLIYALRARKNNSLVAFSICWFFTMLLPQSNLYPINAYMSENWLYLPSIGYFLILANSLVMMHNTKRLRFSECLIILILIFYSALTIKQNDYWKDRLAFCKTTLRYTPNNPKIYNNLGKAYMDIGDYPEAIAAYKKAIALNPNFLYACYNLADSYKAAGEYENAVMEYKKIIEKYPKQQFAYFELGMLYEKFGKKEESLGSYWKVVEIDPKYIQAYNNLASIYAERGEVDKAIGLWNIAVQINPGFATGHFNLAVFYFQQKKYSLAISHCEKVIALGNQVDPKFLKLLQPYRGKNNN